jgi:hypothetical protein
MQYLIYDPRSRAWFSESGFWTTDLRGARRFIDYHSANSVRISLPDAFALYVTEGLAPEQP